MYFLEPDTLTERLQIAALVEQAIPCIRQLVERFDLAGKTLMSVGAGSAQEEIAFLRCGMQRAYLYDIDEHGTLEPALKDIAAQAPRAVLYTVGDFLQYDGMQEPVDLLYFSGFTPDELYKSAIVQDAQSRGVPPGYRWYKNPLVALRRILNGQGVEWPSEAKPLHPCITRACARFLKPGGLLIVQSFAAGLNARHSPSYTAALTAELAQIGMTLQEAYCFTAHPTVSLFIASKGIAVLPRQQPITRFHARAEVADRSVTRFFPTR